MALLDILRDRATRKGGTAQVDCGDLGQLTVEALSIAECARLRGNPRALLYAACRELQAAGAALLQERKVFRPEEITEHLSDSEVAAAVQVILELSGNPEAQETPEATAVQQTSPPPDHTVQKLQEFEEDSKAVPDFSPEADTASRAIPVRAPAEPEEKPTAIPLSSSRRNARHTVQLSSAPANALPAMPTLSEKERDTTSVTIDGFSKARSIRSAEQKVLSPEDFTAIAQEAAKILADELRYAAIIR